MQTYAEVSTFMDNISVSMVKSIKCDPELNNAVLVKEAQSTKKTTNCFMFDQKFVPISLRMFRCLDNVLKKKYSSSHTI
jgi:hypothetical protein